MGSHRGQVALPRKQMVGHDTKARILHPPPNSCSHRLAGQGHLPLTEKTGVRIPMRAPLSFPSSSPDQDAALSMREHGFESRREHSTLLGSRLIGRTADSDSANVGSSPTFPANASSLVLRWPERCPDTAEVNGSKPFAQASNDHRVRSLADEATVF